MRRSRASTIRIKLALEVGLTKSESDQYCELLAILEYTYNTDFGIIGLHSLYTRLPLLKKETVNVSTKLLLLPTPIIQFGI